MSVRPLPRPLGVGVVGFGWMGRVHTHAYTRVRHHYPHLGVAPTLVAVADDVPGRAEEAAAGYGFAVAAQDWRDLTGEPQVEAVSITAPNFLHREIGVAMAAAGKHLWIEKPVGLSAADARAVAVAARAAGVRGAVAFNYRLAPAVAQARQLINAGELGEITHARFRFLSDYAAHPDGALSWRFERARGGSGVLADLASHAIDLVWFLLGDVAALVADTAILIPRRPRPAAPGSGHALAAGGQLGDVENEDYLACLLRLASGARCTLEASRVAVAEQNTYGFEIHGTRGAVSWDFRRLGELAVSLGSAYQDQGVTTMYAGPAHGEFAAFQPGAAMSMSFDDLKVIEVYRFLSAISAEEPGSGSEGATLEDAVRAAVALEAMVESARTGAWVSMGG